MDIIYTVLPSFLKSPLLALGLNPNQVVTTCLVSLLLLTAYFGSLFKKSHRPGSSKYPPMVSYVIPYIGSLIPFGRDPSKFLRAQYDRFGEVFTFLMLGRTMTYLVGNDAHAFFFNAKESDLSAAEAYAPLTVPAFGKGVIYDVSYEEMLEQKKIAKSGLSTDRLKAYVPMIEEETKKYLERWGNEGTVNILQAMEELIVMTASRCLMGPEVRARLDETVARHLWDLDKGFTPINMLFPHLPLPSNRLRDRAHNALAKIFKGIMRERRQAGSHAVQHKDMVHTFMTATYKDNTKMTDDQAANMLIALLLAGQHTSSATGAWVGLFLAHYPQYQKECLDEQKDLFGDDLAPLDYDTLKDAKVLENTVKEVLRLRPPIITMMRKVMKDMVYKNYILPKGHFVCVSPIVAQRLEMCTAEPKDFKPERFETEYSQVGNVLEVGNDDEEEKNTKSMEKKYMYFPFGAGRHRCIGEYFAFVQVKTVWSTLLRMYEVFPEGPMPEIDRTTLVSVPQSPALLRYKKRVNL